MSNQEPQAKPDGGASVSTAMLGHCWLMHRYTKWRDIGSGPLVKPGLDTPVGFFIRQERRCVRCGKVQVRDENVH